MDIGNLFLNCLSYFLSKDFTLFSQQGTDQHVSSYYHSFITIIQSHYSKKTPSASLQDEKMHYDILFIVFKMECSKKAG